MVESKIEEGESMNLLEISGLSVYFPTDDGIVRAVEVFDLNIE